MIKAKYIKVPYYCKKCNRNWNVPFSKYNPNILWNILSAILIPFLGVGVFGSRGPYPYCPNCQTPLKKIKKER